MAATDEIQSWLDQYGLGSLATWAWQQYLNGASIEQIIRDVYDTPEFQQVFPEYKILAAQGRAYSVNQLVEYRKAVAGILGEYGIPKEMITNDLMSSLAAKEVSVAEVSQRVSMYAQAAFATPPEVRQELQDYYGIGPGQLVAYFMNPDQSEQLIKQQYIAAQIGGASQQSGFGMLTRQEAEQLGAQGVDYGQARQGFSDLARNKELFSAVSTGENQIDRQTQLGAEFGGDAQDQQVVERRRQQRLAQFEDGGGYATSQQGIVGV